MMTRIIGDDIREFAIEELWETVEELMREQVVGWGLLAERANMNTQQLKNCRYTLRIGVMELEDAQTIFRALGYELSLTAALIPTNPLPERKSP